MAVDLEVSLHLVPGEDPNPEAQGERPLAEVAPVAQAFG